MPNTFTKIASVSVGVLGASTIDFTSIPSTYTDLCVKLSTRCNYAGGSLLGGLRFNGDTSSIYSNRQLYWDTGGSALSASNSANNFAYALANVGATATSNTFSNNDIYIPNYAGNSNKSYSNDGVAENNATTPIYLVLLAGLWASTSAITSITIFAGGGANFVQYSTATLYGIKNS
tara:strand:- start:360 stop:887 length:528 start_codon:yes stop_codon:yes gene_type:complete